MKIEKGQIGYLNALKRKYLLRALVEFAIVAAVFLLGYVQTKTKQNLFTIVAVVGCLPAAKMLVEFITVSPHKGIEQEKFHEIEEKAPLVMRLYDILFTSEQKAMPVDALVISGHVVCGYASSPRTDEEALAKHIKSVLKDNQYDKMTVKIFHNYTMFLARAEGMNNIAAVERPEDDRNEQNIKKILFNISM
ncbi:hypothetical protein [Sporofaciens musculi]|uniref:hypothetical protein n=1 Tax=Sporofaciens musculi TaxID=2681861 RepID=UPI0025A12FC5|nr:hypothetical protein [Sporofaciens musculi]